MNQETHDRYFKAIAYNTDASFHWPSTLQLPAGAGAENTIGDQSGVGEWPVYAEGLKHVYTARITELVANCRHVKDVAELLSSQQSTSVFTVKTP